MQTRFASPVLFLLLALLVVPPLAAKVRGPRLQIQPLVVTMEGHDRLQFSAVLREIDGAQRTPERLEWSCDGGRVDERGLFLAPERGHRARITVRYRELTASATVLLRPTRRRAMRPAGHAAPHPPAHRAVGPSGHVMPLPPTRQVVSEPPLVIVTPPTPPAPRGPRSDRPDRRISIATRTARERIAARRANAAAEAMRIRRWSKMRSWDRVTVKAGIEVKASLAHAMRLVVEERNGKRRLRGEKPVKPGETVSFEALCSQSRDRAVLFELLDRKGTVVATERRELGDR